MGTIALIFSGLAFYALLRLVNVEVYHFMPTGSPGPEGGLIEAALASIFGLATSTIALLFSFLHFRRDRSARPARALFAWCAFLPVGFLIVFAKMALDYYHGQGQ